MLPEEEQRETWDKAAGKGWPVRRYFPAVTYFPTSSPKQYRRRWGVSLPCSGWERVGPPRQNHQEVNLTPIVCTIFHELARGFPADVATIKALPPAGSGAAAREGRTGVNRLVDGGVFRSG